MTSCYASGTGCRGAALGCCGTGCQIKHNNGVGEYFYDCTPLGTINETQALEACTAYTGNMSECMSETATGGKAPGELSVCSVGSPTDCICWAYQSSTTSGPGIGAAGHVYNDGAAGLMNCQQVYNTDPTWN